MDDEITRAKNEVNRVEAVKESQKKAFNDTIFLNMKMIRVGGPSKPHLEQLRKLSISSIRKLPQFGNTNNNAYPPDFEYPTVQDILAMPIDKPIKIVALNFHPSGDGNYFGGV